MRIVPPDIEISEEEPFLNDVLGRQELVKNVANVMANSPNDLVLFLTGSYGTGKTTTLRMLAAVLRSMGSKVVEFDAWSGDTADDPLPALVSEAATQLANGSELSKKVKTAGVALVKNAVPALIKAMTVGIVDLKETTEATIGAIAESFAESQINGWQAYKSALNEFRSKLEEAVKSSSGDSRLVFLVDELDRCRPDFALKVLERMKHVFDVNGVSFIVAMDERQMLTTIKGMYGSSTDAHGYLRKFFDLAVPLPDPDRSAFVRSTFVGLGFAEYFRKRSTWLPTVNDGQILEGHFCELAGVFELTLREIQKWCTVAGFVMFATPPGQRLFPVTVSFATLLSVKDPDSYSGVRDGTIGVREIVEMLSAKVGGLDYLYKGPKGAVFAGELMVTLPRDHTAGAYSFADERIADEEEADEVRQFWREAKRHGQYTRDGRHFENVLAMINTKMTMLGGVQFESDE